LLPLLPPVLLPLLPPLLPPLLLPLLLPLLPTPLLPPLLLPLLPTPLLPSLLLPLLPPLPPPLPPFPSILGLHSQLSLSPSGRRTNPRPLLGLVSIVCAAISGQPSPPLHCHLGGLRLAVECRRSLDLLEVVLCEAGPFLAVLAAAELLPSPRGFSSALWFLFLAHPRS
jgi:hypothetical protein